MLADFAVKPVKIPAPMSNETLLLRAARNQATRKERRTMGKKQRRAIKGDVTGVVITPTTDSPNKPQKK